MGSRSCQADRRQSRTARQTRRDENFTAEKLSSGLTAWRYKHRVYEEIYNTEMRGIIFHYGLFKIIWDWFVLLLVLYTAIEVPFVVAFFNDSFSSASTDTSTFYDKGNTVNFVLLLVDLLVDLFFFCDIIVNFRTTYIGKNDELITDPKKIATRYFRTYFIVDLVAAIPWDVIAEHLEKSTTSLSLLKSVRLLRLFQAARRLDQNYEKSVYLLFLMVFAFTLVAHWLACIWYAIGDYESRKPTPNSWLTILAEDSEHRCNQTSFGLSGPHLRSRYLTSLYFTLTCLTSVGFGNVSANTDIEKLFTIISMLIGGLLFAAVFGNVSAIIYGHYSGTFKFRERMQSVKSFIGFHKIKGPLARKVKDYARHMWTQTKGISTMKVMKQFPQSLQEEISCYLHFNVVKNCPLFENAEESCLWSLAVRMLRLHNLPNNVIIRQGSIVNSVYFISRGKLDVCRNGAVVGTIGEGDAFGHLYLNGKKMTRKSAVTLRCLSCVDIHILELEDLNNILESFPEFSRELQMNIDNILRKTVLTSQILNSWDAIESVEESFSENRGLKIFTWLRRQKSKHTYNVDNDHVDVDHSASRNVTERLVSIPLVVLNPGDSSDDAQKRWRFANIVECREEKTDGIYEGQECEMKKKHMGATQHNQDSVEEKKYRHNFKNNCKCAHRKNEDMLPDNFKKDNETLLNVDVLDHSQDCEFHETTTEEDKNILETKSKLLESTVQQMNRRIETLDSKIDKILQILQKQPTANT